MDEAGRVICPDTRLIEPLGPRAFRAELPNGHQLTAFCRESRVAAALRPGARVRLRLSPADFSRGEVLGPTDLAEPAS